MDVVAELIVTVSMIRSTSSTAVAMIPLTIMETMQWMNQTDCECTEVAPSLEAMVWCVRRLEWPLDLSFTVNVDLLTRTSLLHNAGRYGHEACVRTLLSIDPTLSKVVDNEGQTALHHSAWNGHEACIRTLLSIDP
eukprot:PhF_6_TR916/c0_g1_i4/m.1531